MRRLIGLLVILVILAAAWVGGWFWLAGYVERNAEPTLKQIADRGVEIDCPNRTIGGFPFAIRVVCGTTAVAERSSGTHASLPGASGGASIFKPMVAEVELQSPMRVESPLLDGPLEMRWKDASVDVGVNMSGPRDIRFTAADFLGAFSLPGAPEQTVTAAHADARLAPSANGGTTVSTAFTDFAFAAGGTRFPPVSGTASAEISVPPRDLTRGRAGVKLPVEARGIAVAIESNGARFAIEGDIALEPEGVLDGTLLVRVAGAEALPEFIAALPEEFQRIGNFVAAGLFAFGQPTNVNGVQGAEVRVTIDANHARIGPVEVELPRVRL